MDKSQIHKGLLCYRLKRVARRRWVVPTSMRQMVVKYFHDAVLTGHLGDHKSCQRIGGNFWWQKIRTEFLRICVGVICVSARKPHRTRALVCTRLLRTINLWKIVCGLCCPTSSNKAGQYYYFSHLGILFEVCVVLSGPKNFVASGGRLPRKSVLSRMCVRYFRTPTYTYN